MRPTVVLRSATRILVVYTAYAGAGLAHDDVPDANAASLRSTYAVREVAQTVPVLAPIPLASINRSSPD